MLSRWATPEATQTNQFITNNHASFHLWPKENLVKHEKFSQYYVLGCLRNFLFHFMLLFTVQVVKKSHILAGIYFIFLKKHRRPK